MPSWNIHIAHVQRLLHEQDARALGICDANAFLFGNLVPDVYVGYLVRPTSRTVPYRVTHFADPAFVPQPAYWEFWTRYARASADEHGKVSDVVLGAWMHLLADSVYNAANNRFIAEHGIEPCEETRKRKQADFDLFGRTLELDIAPQVSRSVLQQAAAFPQYPIGEEDAIRAIAVADDVVEQNSERHVAGTPRYCMLDASFFSRTYENVYHLMVRNLRAYAEHGALGCGERGSDGNA